VTIEMSYEETMNRYHAVQTGYPVLDIGHKRIMPENQGDYFEKLIAASKEPEVRPAFLRECQAIKNRKDPKFALKISKKYANRKAKMFVVDMEAATPARIEQEMQRIMMDHKLDCVFVDFLNVMDPEFANKDRVRELTSISRSMKKIARKSGTVLFTAAQMDTTGLEGTQDEVLRPDMVKYAKAIAENADWLIAFHRTEEDKAMKQVRLQLAKHRHSSDCTALLEFDFGTMQAIDLGFAPGTFIPEGYSQTGDKIGTGAYSSYTPAAEPKAEPHSQPLPIPAEKEPEVMANTVDDALAMISKTFSVRSVREVRSETKDMKAEVKAFQINESENDGQ
jgi:replicative DNA helicase